MNFSWIMLDHDERRDELLHEESVDEKKERISRRDKPSHTNLLFS
jgi:hypothetical protein